MHVGIITYQIGHLKTWQMMRRYLTKGFRITLFAFPFKLRPAKDDGRYQDRPSQIIDLDVEAFCAANGIGYRKVEGWGDAFASELDCPGGTGKPDVYVTCIAKIIPAAFIAGRTILNCHPGLLPHNRGVDAFKWCVINKWPFGVTLHVIDHEIDRGTILHRMRVPVWPGDTLGDVWRRAYDVEGDLLGNFDLFLGNAAKDWQVGDDHPCSHRKIPMDSDQSIERMFLDNRDEFVRLSADLDAMPHPADEIYQPFRL